MEIVDVESTAVSIPLDNQVSFATRSVTERDHAIVRIRTSDGLEGVGYTLGYGGAGLIADAVDTVLRPMIEGEDPRDTERLWREMFDGTVQIGRKGVIVRAISMVDIALWDVKAKAAGMALHKLLGGHSEEVPAYASGGYYRDEKGLEGLCEEVQYYVDAGHDVLKMKVGRAPVPDDVERIRAVRETIGPDRTLLLDANGRWSTEQEAVRACRAFGEFDPYFIEEPVMPDSVDLMEAVNEALDYPVAAGELEYTRYGFVDLLARDAIGIAQPDVTVVGGVTEWLKVAHHAASLDVPIAPHYNSNLHAQLLGAIENALWAEYFYPESGANAFDAVLVDPLVPEDGVIRLPDRPGHGVELDWDRVEEFAT